MLFFAFFDFIASYSINLVIIYLADYELLPNGDERQIL